MREERATVVEEGGGRALWATVVCCCMFGGRVSVETETRVSTMKILCVRDALCCDRVEMDKLAWRGDDVNCCSCASGRD